MYTIICYCDIKQRHTLRSIIATSWVPVLQTGLRGRDANPLLHSMGDPKYM